MTGAARAAVLIVAFRDVVDEPDAEAGFQRIRSLADAPSLSDAELARAVTACIGEGTLREPVRLMDGSLHCCWKLTLTAKGVAAARMLLEPRDDA